MSTWILYRVLPSGVTHAIEFKSAFDALAELHDGDTMYEARDHHWSRLF